MADRALEQRRAIHLDTVDLVNLHGAAAVTPELLHDRLDRRRPPVPEPVPSIDEVYTSLITELTRTHLDAVTATVTRRRSLTDSLQIALAAHWDTVVSHADEHRAVRKIEARRRDTADVRAAVTADQTPDDAGSWTAATGVSTWLGLVADAHHIRWELPDEQLTLLIASTVEGLTMNFLATGDPEPARAVLRVVAYQVAQYGRRPAKNQQH